MATRALLLSIRPKYADLIFSGKKKMELRRTRPRIGKDDLALIYVSSPVKSLVGAILVTNVVELPPEALWAKAKRKAAITRLEFDEYFAGAEKAFAIEFSRCWELVEPVSLKMLRARRRGFHPPQSFRYLNGADLGSFLVTGLRRPSSSSCHRRGIRQSINRGG